MHAHRGPLIALLTLTLALLGGAAQAGPKPRPGDPGVPDRELQKAIDADPGFARAYAGLANLESFTAQWIDPTPQPLEAADAASRKALELAPERSESHVSAGIAQCMVQAYDQAEAAFERAIELAPRCVQGRYLYAMALMRCERIDDAVDQLELALEVDEDYGRAKLGRDPGEGRFDVEKFREQAKDPQVKMIEVKLSQGAKPGHGGILPARKVTQEISEIRGVPLGADVHSPPAHSTFSTPRQ